MACLTNRILDRGAVTWPAVSECAFARMGGIFKDFHRKQRGIGEEFPTGDQGVGRAWVADSVAFEVDLLEVEGFIAKCWGSPRSLICWPMSQVPGIGCILQIVALHGFTRETLDQRATVGRRGDRVGFF